MNLLVFRTDRLVALSSSRDDRTDDKSTLIVQRTGRNAVGHVAFSSRRKEFFFHVERSSSSSALEIRRWRRAGIIFDFVFICSWCIDVCGQGLRKMFREKMRRGMPAWPNGLRHRTPNFLRAESSEESGFESRRGCCTILLFSKRKIFFFVLVGKNWISPTWPNGLRHRTPKDLLRQILSHPKSRGSRPRVGEGKNFLFFSSSWWNFDVYLPH